MTPAPDNKTSETACSGGGRRRSLSLQMPCAVVAGALLGQMVALPKSAQLLLAANGEAGRVIVDMADRKVTVPEQIHRAGCFEVLCYDKLFLLGGRGLVATMLRTDPPWMSTIDPNVARIPKVETEAPNREQVLADGIDIVFLRYNRLLLRGLESTGIPAVVSQPPLDTHFEDAVAFGNAQKRMVRLFGSIIGGAAVQKAEEWCAYFDERIQYVMKRVADVPQAKRPRAYYLRGPNATQTQGPGTNTYWYGRIAGADMISSDLPFNSQGPMSMEEILRRDPVFIFVGRQYSPGLVLNDARWRDVGAVKNHRVIALPDGLFYWDGSTEGVLLAELMAKTLYPDRFGDLDVPGEVRRYYKRFYGYEFTDDALAKFMRGLTPAGIRRGY